MDALFCVSNRRHAVTNFEQRLAPTQGQAMTVHKHFFLVTKIIHSNNLIDMGFSIVAYQNKVNIVTQLAKSYNDIFGVYHTFMYAFTYIGPTYVA